MMGRLKSEQGQLFCQFNLEDAVPDDQLVRRIDAALDLCWLRRDLSPHYSSMGRPSIDPELMIRILVVGYVFAIRSERWRARAESATESCLRSRPNFADLFRRAAQFVENADHRSKAALGKFR